MSVYHTQIVPVSAASGRLTPAQNHAVSGCRRPLAAAAVIVVIIAAVTVTIIVVAIVVAVAVATAANVSSAANFS